MAIKEAKKRCLFRCDVTGLVGMFVGWKDAEAKNPDKDDDAKRIVYIPIKDVNEGMKERWKGVRKYKHLWEVTNTVYLKQGIIGPKPVPDPYQEAGLFDMMVVATQDEDGRAGFRKNFVAEELEYRLDELVADKNAAETEKGHSELKNTTSESTEIGDENNRSKTRQPNQAEQQPEDQLRDY